MSSSLLEEWMDVMDTVGGRQSFPVFNPTSSVSFSHGDHMKMRIRGFFMICLLVWCMPTALAQGQRTPGLSSGARLTNFYIEGRVVDESGVPVYMARIVLTSVRSGNGQTTHTDHAGRFAFYNLREGSYNVNVSASGFISINQAIEIFGGSKNLEMALRRSTGVPDGALPEAISVHQLSIPPKAQALYQKGRKELDRQKVEKSVGYFQAAIEEYAAFAQAHSGLGIAYIRLRNPDLARKALTRALELNGELAEAHLGMGVLCNDAEQHADAEKHLLKAQRLMPTEWHVYFELGRAYYGMDQLENAEKNLRIARQARPKFGTLYLLLGNVFVLQEKYAEGLAEFDEFLKVAPESPLAAQVREKIKLLKEEVAKRQ